MKPEPMQRLGATRPSGWRLWWTAVRPRTLTIAATPVLLGSALARAGGTPLDWLLALATLACALAIQAGTNLHNDAAGVLQSPAMALPSVVYALLMNLSALLFVVGMRRLGKESGLVKE